MRYLIHLSDRHVALARPISQYRKQILHPFHQDCIKIIVQSTSHNSDHTGLADFVRITENPDYVETFSVLHFNMKLIGLSNSVRNIQKSG